MFQRIKLKKSDVIVVETATPLPLEIADKVLAQFKMVFPDNQVFMPNGAKISIIETEE